MRDYIVSILPDQSRLDWVSLANIDRGKVTAGFAWRASEALEDAGSDRAKGTVRLAIRAQSREDGTALKPSLDAHLVLRQKESGERKRSRGRMRGTCAGVQIE